MSSLDEKKQKRREANKKYYQKNREKEIRRVQMATSKEDKKAYDKKRYDRMKAEGLLKPIVSTPEQKRKKSEAALKWYYKNREKINERRRKK
jgi:hypothetical protein